MAQHVITLNAGSSSVKFALFSLDRKVLELIGSGAAEGLGATPSCHARKTGSPQIDIAMQGTDHAAAIQAISGWIGETFPGDVIGAVGHRIVHGGMDYAAPVLIDAAVYKGLEVLSPLAPLHQPHNLAGVRAAQAVLPDVPQVACFDTAFHRGHDFVNETYGLPRAMFERGIRRFGFHGLSYEYISTQLPKIDPERARGRVVVAHLGNGASLCAMKDGRSCASSMGFSALEGLAMGTRSGEIDPGVLLYLMDHEKMTSAELTHLLYHDCGLKGLSGLSQDMRELETSTAPAASEAIAYFTHRIRLGIAEMAAVLEGLDAVIFTAGIGEHSARVRAEVVSGLGWLGLTLDAQANARHATRITTSDSSIPTYVVATNEESMIAHHAAQITRLA